ncbi:Protein CBG14941 [Caenorhabditis briggsae]|uniref:Protein CBG14941 n=2 Tax=Caenorhabditis briggsae TaxID=6238 RepID=A8XL21_CAEBR|nr:Protein CBG14941 [Caenorhabditis briggsae]CAP33345.1 Protein CBG14941 [Caenorhabditis briggsae]
MRFPSAFSSSTAHLLESSPIDDDPGPSESIALQTRVPSQTAEKLVAEISDDSEDEEEELHFRTVNDTNPILTYREMVLRIALIAMLYYPLSIGLTFYQKWFIKNYKLPLLVVSGHYILKYLFAVIIRFIYECVRAPRMRVSLRDQMRWLAPIGICASMDIGLSNWALEYVTVSLYTMAKSSSILFIVAFSLLLRLERWRNSLGFETGLIAAGLFLFTWKSSQLDLTGLLLVELAAACTGIRWTVSQLVMQRDDSAVRHPLDMVAHVQPWMMIPIIPMIWLFEGAEINWNSVFSFQGHYDPWLVVGLISGGGLLAFCMEISEYLLLVNTSGITLNIFGIVKEVATLLLAHLINKDKLTELNICGLVLCLSGMLLHGMNKRRQRTHRPLPSCSTTSRSEDSRKLLSSEELEA